MALFDEERRRLEKLEQDLAASDPDLARKLQSGVPRGRAAAGSLYAIGAARTGFAWYCAPHRGLLQNCLRLSVRGSLQAQTDRLRLTLGSLPGPPNNRN